MNFEESRKLATATPQPVTQPSRVERRKERLRRRIIEVATELYDKNGGENGGFENTTIETIAELSEISLSTFFRYFESKQDVIYLDCRQAVVELDMHVRPLLGTMAPVDAAFVGCMRQLEAFIAAPVNRSRLIRALKSPNFIERRGAWQQQSQARLKELIEPHLADAHNPSLAAGTIALAVRGAIHEALDIWILDPSGDPAPLVREAMRELAANAALLGNIK